VYADARPPWLRRLAFGAALVGAVALLRAATLVVPIYNSDEAYLAVQGRVLLDGGRLYRDVVDTSAAPSRSSAHLDAAPLPC
jgi:hypothetical protein